MSTADELVRWRDELAAWAIPQYILDQAPASPWTPERSVFVRRAAARRRKPEGISFERAREALPSGGSVLDVGAGAGAASLPLLDRAGALTAVDQDGPLLEELTAQAGAQRDKVKTIVGTWPGAASAVRPADVVVCHHVLYNVPELEPFIEALDAHARKRVVIEITAQHPLARLNPLWRRFHGLERPTRPTWEDALRAIRSFHTDVHVDRAPASATPAFGSWDELVGATTRRLCLPYERQREVADALTELGAVEGDPATWAGPDHEVITFWWDVSTEDPRIQPPPGNKEADAMTDDLTITREGDTLVIRLPMKAPTPSASGKTLVVASTRGNQKTTLQIDGRDLYLGVNAYVYAEPKGSK